MRVHLKNAEAVTAAARDMIAKLASQGLRPESFIVMEHAPQSKPPHGEAPPYTRAGAGSGVEAIIGGVQNPTYGPVVRGMRAAACCCMLFHAASLLACWFVCLTPHGTRRRRSPLSVRRAFYCSPLSQVAFGLGGIHVEVLKDVAFRMGPITTPEAERLVRHFFCLRTPIQQAAVQPAVTLLPLTPPPLSLPASDQVYPRRCAPRRPPRAAPGGQEGAPRGARENVAAHG